MIFWLENYANSQELLPVNSIYRELQAQKKFKSWMNLNGQIFCHLEPFLLFTIMPFRFSKASLPENLNYFSLISLRKQPTVSNHWRGREMSVVFSGYSLIRVPKLRGHLSATMLCLTYVYVFFLPQSHCTQRKYTLVSQVLIEIYSNKILQQILKQIRYVVTATIWTNSCQFLLE